MTECQIIGIRIPDFFNMWFVLRLNLKTSCLNPDIS